MSVYQSFDFKKKVECVVFFHNRQDFTKFYAAEYGFKDEYSEEGQAVHYLMAKRASSGWELLKG